MLIEQELTEQREMWELFARLMDFEPDFQFTAREVAQSLDYNKSYVSRLLYRLYINKALVMHKKTAPGGAKLYSLNRSFLGIHDD